MCIDKKKKTVLSKRNRVEEGSDFPKSNLKANLI